MANTIKIGSIEADAIKIGTSTVSKVYVGTELVYPSGNENPIIDDGNDPIGGDDAD